MALLIKICGLRTAEAANQAIEAGADLLGVIMVPGRKRTVALDVAAEISKLAQNKRKALGRQFQSVNEILNHINSLKFDSHRAYFQKFKVLVEENGPFLVGVFRNQNIEDVFKLANQASVDFIQLHGSEDVSEYLARNDGLKYGIIKRYVIPDHTEQMKEFFPKVLESTHQGFGFPLLDSELGGEGQTIDWTLINDLDGDFMLAGGLNAENLSETKPFLKNVFGFDVSGGVENENGDKDLDKISRFVANGKQVLT
ncbi:hypothetical protein PUMCH_004774 [Australozyma saopauloensis]|uniref:N-(5'-phosphoribosyl)anthranilate isomerase n=1 Tax=Australozyma saopauloensis TaxID=291208 RepID=A0AAX4HH88_9ASCO|nr:hypothetical protein PUMCH_004774 [[Candida] saopauloensis]